MRKMLVAYSMSSSYVQTTSDYLNALASNLGYEAAFLHVTHDAYVDLDIATYDLVFHSYCARFCFPDYVSKSYCSALKRFCGLKVLAVQDEYDNTDRTKKAIKDYGFQAVLTCVPADQLEYVYPKAEFPGVEFICVLTGYVPDEFAEAHPSATPLADRPILIGYRGRDIGPRYGRLGFDKFEIGRRMKAECEARGFPCDIAMDDASRIYGPAWFEFIGNCRAMLGTESGSNVFDFNGALAAQLASATKRLGRLPTHQEFLPVIGDRESKIDMGQISPRVFECAVMRTPMVLYRGRYSGAILPDEHYIALEHDFSNLDDVFRRIKDLPALEAMTERAYRHLVASGRFGYRAFGAMLRDRFESLFSHMVKLAPVDAVDLPTPSPQQRILHEMPSKRLKGLDDLRLVQMRMAGLTQLPQMRALERIYVRSMSDSLAAIDVVARLRKQWASERHLENSAGLVSVAALRQRYRDIISARDRRLKERSAFREDEDMASSETDASSRDALDALQFDALWFAEFSVRYLAFEEGCTETLRNLRLEINAYRVAQAATLSPFKRQAYLQYYRLRDSAILAIAQARAAKLAYAKALVRKVPFARQMAVKVLRIAGGLR